MDNREHLQPDLMTCKGTAGTGEIRADQREIAPGPKQIGEDPRQIEADQGQIGAGQRQRVTGKRQIVSAQRQHQHVLLRTCINVRAVTMNV